MFKPCIIIPVYKHVDVLASFIADITQAPLLLVDDGNNAEDVKKLVHIAEKNNAMLISTDSNKGKGGAMILGFNEAIKHGYTHALQIDADAQHSKQDIAVFLNTAKENPNALINSYPVYDDSVVRVRKTGRKFTNLWVHIETLSTDIKDAMCGFRVYPLKKIESIVHKKFLSLRMGYDIEIIVKAHWKKIKIINLPVDVVYPAGGHSNYRMVVDNIKISFLHATLFTMMLVSFLKPKKAQ